MLVPMAHVEIVCHRRRLPAVLACLQRLATVHIVRADHTPELGGRLYVPTEGERAELAQLRYLRARLDALAQLAPDGLAVPQDEVDIDPDDIPAVRAELEAVSEQVNTLSRRIDALSAEREVLPRHLAALRRLQPLVPEEPLEGYETVALLLESEGQAIVSMLHAALPTIVGQRYELVSGRVEGGVLGVVLLFPRDASTEVHDLLGREQVGRVRLPEGFEGLPFGAAVEAMARRIEALPFLIEEQQQRLVDELRARSTPFRARAWIGQRIEQLEVLDQVGATEAATAVVGWAPLAEVERIERTLQAEVGDEVILAWRQAEQSDEPPVLMHNIAPSRPFESLIEMYDLPGYGTLDPTLLMSLFMPLFFGMMLGDVVYGVILAILSGIAWRRFRGGGIVADLSRIMLYGSLWSIVWGVLYGEYLGDLGRHLLHIEPVWINREEAIAPLLIFSIAVGVVHLLLGLLLGIWTAIRLRAGGLILERVGMVSALIGLLVLAAIAAGQVPSVALTPALAATLVGAIVLGQRHGIAGVLMGPLEVVSLAGNVLSYLRIAAIGMASAYLARVANELGALGPLWLGIAVAALFHALNLALGAFSPTIQALRLHYVEFFGKFYERGGQSFRAFGGPTGAPGPTPRQEG